MANKKDVAAHLFMTERNLEYLIKKHSGAPVAHGRGQWDVDAMRRWYINVLKEQAKATESTPSQPDPDDDPVKVYEKRKRDLELQKLEADVDAKIIKNRKDLREWGPISLMEFAVSQLAGNLQSRLAGFVPRLKLACPEMTPDMMARADAEVIKLQNECANANVDFTDYEDGDFESDYEGTETA